jgi:hypothetical protein
MEEDGILESLQKDLELEFELKIHVAVLILTLKGEEEATIARFVQRLGGMSTTSSSINFVE